MHKEIILRWAKEAGWDDHHCQFDPRIERFATIVINETIKASQDYKLGYADGVFAEREECAKVCDRMAARTNDIRSAALEMAAENIRARGNA